MTAQQSLWQMAAAIDGYNRAQGGEETPPELTNEEFDAMIERNAEWMASLH